MGNYGSGEGTVSPGQEIRRFLEEVKLEFGLPVVGLGIWGLLGSTGLLLLLWVPQKNA